MKAARQQPDTRRVSTLTMIGTDVPGMGARSAQQLNDAAPKKFASFFCRTELSRNDYFDAVAVGRRFFEIAGDSCRELASWDDVRAAVARGEVWEG